MVRDVLHSLRRFRRTAGVTAAAIFTLALGIGATTAAFSEVNAMLLRPLPFPHPDRLVIVWEPGGGGQAMLSPRDYLDLAPQLRSFDHFAANWGNNLDAQGWCSLNLGRQPEAVLCASVTHSFFTVLGVKPLLGKTFDEADESFAIPRVAILSYRLWRRSFGGDPGVVGRQIKMDGAVVAVIGVMPPGFELPARCDVWLPPPFDEFFRSEKGRSMRLLRGLGRLKSGVSLPDAQREFEQAVGRLPLRSAGGESQLAGRLVPLKDVMVGDWRLGLLLVEGAACLVLLIACANLANLLLVMGVHRRRELAIRAATGAAPSRIVRQLLTESVVLALFGGVGGVLLAAAGARSLVALSPAGMPRLGEARLDGFVLGVTLLVCLVAGVLFGLVPALAAIRTGLHESLGEGARISASSRVTSAIVIAEVALATVVSASAWLVLSSYLNMQRVNPGLDPRGVLTMKVVSGFQNETSAFTTRLLERVRAVPGIQAAASAVDLPLGGWVWDFRFSVGNAPAESGGARHTAHQHVVSPDYFRAMGIPLLKGRSFRDGDRRYGAAIISQEFERRHFGGQSAVGKHVFPEKFKPIEVIGVVGSVKHRAISEPFYPEIYFPGLAPYHLAVRSALAPEQTARAVRAAVMAVDPDGSIAEVRTMDETISSSLARERYWTILLGVFALLAQALAVIGVYGVVSYSVNRRAAEFGIRAAVGARPHDIRRQVLLETLRLAVCGGVVGVLVLLAIARFVASLLYQISATDPLILGFSAVAGVVIALAAGLAPAERAARFDANVILRNEQA